MRLGTFASLTRRHGTRSAYVYPNLLLSGEAWFRPSALTPIPTTSMRTPHRTLFSSSRPFFQKEKEESPKRRRIVMRKPPVTLTDTARSFFQKLLQSPPRDNVIGIMLDYHQSTSGEPRMVYSFRFVNAKDIDDKLDESVPLWEEDSTEPTRPKLYVHHNAFLKVLGAKLDVDVEKVTPILYDREGNLMDPNA